MKTTYILLLSMTVLAFGCAPASPFSEEANPTTKTDTLVIGEDNSAIPLVMDLCILFKDAAGRNLVQGIPTDQYPIYTRGHKDLDQSYYTMSTTVDQSFELMPIRMQTYYVGGGARLLLPLFIYAYDVNKKLDKVAFAVTCPYVFGNDKVHTVVGYCNHDKLYEPYYTRVEVDGKEYPFERLKEEPSVFLLSVVLDR